MERTKGEWNFSWSSVDGTCFIALISFAHSDRRVSTMRIELLGIILFKTMS